MEFLEREGSLDSASALLDGCEMIYDKGNCF